MQSTDFLWPSSLSILFVVACTFPTVNKLVLFGSCARYSESFREFEKSAYHSCMYLRIRTAFAGERRAQWMPSANKPTTGSRCRFASRKLCI